MSERCLTLAEWGERLKLERERASLSQEELAFLTSSDQRAISRYEQGQRRPTPQTFQRLNLALEGQLRPPPKRSTLTGACAIQRDRLAQRKAVADGD